MRAASRKRRPVGSLALVVSLWFGVQGGASGADAASLVDPYWPGVVAAEVGDDLVVNAHGVDGLGVHRTRLDNGSTAFAVWIQANAHHSTSAAYAVSGRTANSAALTVRLSGAGGPISGEPVTFTSADGLWTEQAVTGDDGHPAGRPAAGTSSVRVSAHGPGNAIEYAAAGAERLAVAGRAEQLSVDIALPAAPETTTATTTTAMVETTTTTTTARPETTLIVATTTSVSTASTVRTQTSTPEPESTASTTTTGLPPSTTSATTSPLPEAFPMTGSGSRVVVRIGALFFALGGIVSYVTAGSRRRS